MLFDIDWQGTRQIAEAMPDDIVRIFVLPPSMAELRARLERRAEDGAEVIGRRLANARNEIRHWDEYEYVIVNEDLQTSLADGAHDPPCRAPEARAPAGPRRARRAAAGRD